MDAKARDIRFEIFKHYLQTCRPPTTAELAERTSSTIEEVGESLKSLEKLHHLTLYEEHVPSLSPIAMCHPFSHLPTPYIVTQGKKAWWANCAWCSFGLVSMLSRETLDQTITLMIKSGSIGEELRFDILNENITSTSMKSVAHFVVPPSQFWIDVRYTCSTIQLFKSETEVDRWCETHGFPKGAVISFAQLWQLAKAWYHDKADHGYDRKGPEEVAELYASLGMAESFWEQ